jgi:serine/threonine protein kinase/Flp pilus assembly protein TadD
VYLAEDTELHRKVSLKFLARPFTEDKERLSRFEHEARAASALNDPNILTVYEFGDANGHRFIATEFVDGQTLRHRLRSPMEIDEGIDIAIQIASALVAAHRVNIVHRDIKPENIMIRKDDALVKLLDFGLAKTTELVVAPDALTVDKEAQTRFKTAPGMVMGTVAYMSPEQARGDVVDERTDIWSLGVVLYEMLAGCSPFFAGTSNEIISLILSRQSAPPLVRYSPGVPQQLEAIVEKALTKNRDERYQTSKELLIDLKRLRKAFDLEGRSDSSAQSEKPGIQPTERLSNTLSADIVNPIKTHKRHVIAALAIVVATAAVALFLFNRPKSPASFSPAQIKSLAVLPLTNLSGDSAQEYFADGMTEALISSLTQIRALRVISRISAMRYKGTAKSLQEIADELKVDAVIEGSVKRSGGRVLVTARLIPAATDSPLWSREFDRDLSDVLKLQSEIARAVTDEIRIQLTADEKSRLASARSINPQAHEAYLLGRYHLAKLNEDGIKLAINYFEQAIQIAPDSAIAYSGLGEAWLERGIWGAKTFNFKEVEAPARDAVLKAAALDDHIAEVHMMLGQIKYIYDWDWLASEHEFKRALELEPGSVAALRYYAILLMALGRHAEAITEIQQAAQLDPLSSDVQSNYGRILYRARKYEEAITPLKRALELDPNLYSAHVRLGDVYSALGRYDEAIAMFDKAAQLRSEGQHTVRLARIYALTGRQREAREILNRVQGGAFETAGAYVALGDTNEALKILEHAVEERSSLLVFIKEDPTFDKLHSDPRWQRLLQRMNFPE